MTRLDLLLAATIAVVAFALGTSLGPDVATAWKRSIAPSATYELRERVPTYREALATFDSRQAKVRNRIAEEHLAILAATQAGAPAAARRERRRTLRALYDANAALTSQQAEARVALAHAERRAGRQEERDRTRRRWDDKLGTTLVALVAAGLLVGALGILVVRVGTPAELTPVAAGAVALLAVLVVGDAFGWVAAAALVVLAGTIVIGRGARDCD